LSNNDDSVKRPSIKTNSTSNNNSINYKLKLLDTPYTLSKPYNNETWAMDISDSQDLPYITTNLFELISIVLVDKYKNLDKIRYDSIVISIVTYIHELFKTHKDTDILDTFDIYSYVDNL